MEILLEVYAGLFFAISGYHKLFNSARHRSLVDTLKADNIPLIGINQWFVPFVEFSGGIALVVHLHPVLTGLAALGLFILCAVATITDGIKRIASYQPIDKADWIDDLLYLPETMLLLMLALSIAANLEVLL